MRPQRRSCSSASGTADSRVTSARVSSPLVSPAVPSDSRARWSSRQAATTWQRCKRPQARGDATDRPGGQVRARRESDLGSRPEAVETRGLRFVEVAGGARGVAAVEDHGDRRRARSDARDQRVELPVEQEAISRARASCPWAAAPRGQSAGLRRQTRCTACRGLSSR